MVRKSLALGIVFLFVFSSIGSVGLELKGVDMPPVESVNGPMDSAWSMQSHDTHHTGRSLYSTINTTDTEKWIFETDGWIEDTPIIDNESVIYFGGSFNELPEYLFAVYPNGSLKWRCQLDGQIIGSSPAIAEDGTIYVGTWRDYLFAVNPNGTIKWRFCVYDNIHSSPVIAEDGTIYFGTMGNNIYALNPNGTEKWRYTTGYKVTSDPAIGDDGTVYIGSGDSYLYALYPNGTLKWQFDTADEIHGHPSIADDGTIYIASWDGYLYAVYPNGTEKWRCSAGPYICSNPSIAEDGTIYIGSDKLYAFYLNGTLRWDFDLGSGRRIFRSSPAICADGMIYVGTHIGEGEGGEIIAVNPDGTERWRKLIATDWADSSPCIGEDGTVYIGSSSHDQGYSYGYLHAFGELDPDAPIAPTISGETDGEAGVEYEYTFSTIDPNDDDVYYYIEWGDGEFEDWFGPYDSGEEVIISHTWDEQNTYTLRARAKDTDNLWGPWGELEVTMPVNQHSYSFPLLQRFLERFPNAFPILRFLLT